jgi:hypothetical protein
MRAGANLLAVGQLGNLPDGLPPQLFCQLQVHWRRFLVLVHEVALAILLVALIVFLCRAQVNTR